MQQATPRVCPSQELTSKIIAAKFLLSVVTVLETLFKVIRS